MKRKFYLHIQLIITLLLTATSGVCGFAQTQTVVTSYRANGTFTVPYNVDHIVVECWGAGGGGGGRKSSIGGSGGGGGGAYASSTIASPVQGTSYTITVGTGGSGGSSNDGTGGTGGNTSFGTLVVAAGGSGGSTTTGGAGGSTVASTGTILYAGGIGGGGNNSYTAGSGGGGGAAGPGGAGGNGGNIAAGAGGPGSTFIIASERNGALGITANGNGNSLTASGNNSNNGTYGGGGGGAFRTNSSYSGGSGSVGYVRITIYYTNLPTCSSGNWKVVNGSLQTFGKGTNSSSYGSALNSITGLSWQKTDCPNDGYYAIRSASNDCFSSSWVTVSQDHTNEPYGYFLLANSKQTPSQIYSQNVSGDACSNTTYRISFWALNPHRNLSSQLPNIELDLYKADGTTLISSYLTGDIPLAAGDKDWKQYYATFQLPSGTSSYVLGMILTTPGGPIYGSDIFIDDIEVEKCDPTIISTISSSNSCQNTQFTLSANAAPYDTPVYQWQRSIDNTTYNDIAGATTLSYNYTESTPGTYYYRLLAAASVADLNTIKSGNTACGVSTDFKQLIVNAIPTISGQPSTSGQTLCQNSVATALSVTATAGIGSISGYQWYSNITPSNSGGTLISGATDSNYTPLASVSGTLYYYVIVTNSYGCTFTSNVSGAITVNPLPTASISGTTSVCQNATSPVITFTGSNGTTPYKFSYSVSDGTNTTSAIVTSNSSGVATVPAPTTTVGTFTYTLTSVQDASSTTCSNTASGSAIITVNTLPNTYAVTGGGSYCVSGSGVPVGLSGSQSGVDYQLQLNGSNSGASVAGTGSAISFGNQISAGTYTVTATNASTGCSVIMNRNATITINSLPATPTVSNSIVSNTCPSSTVNIAGLITSSTPSGCSLLYKTTNDPAGIDVTDPTKVGTGTYYIFYKNASGCSSYPSTSVTVTIHSCNDLSITKAVSDMNPLVGTDITFTITAYNGSTTMVTATEVKVADKLLPNYAFKSYTVTTGTYDNATGIWTIGSLSPKSSAVLTITATVQ